VKASPFQRVSVHETQKFGALLDNFPKPFPLKFSIYDCSLWSGIWLIVAAFFAAPPLGPISLNHGVLLSFNDRALMNGS
jgi:hypothetical protein